MKFAGKKTCQPHMSMHILVRFTSGGIPAQLPVQGLQKAQKERLRLDQATWSIDHRYFETDLPPALVAEGVREWH
jgi:hypothetical protein